MSWGSEEKGITNRSGSRDIIFPSVVLLLVMRERIKTGVT